MRTTIPWGDGSGDNIYLDYAAASGDQTILVSSDANAGSVKRTKDIVFSASGASAVTLHVEQPEGVNLFVTTYDGIYPSYSDVSRGFSWTLPGAYRRLKGIVFDGGVYYATTYRLRGEDTLRFSFLVTATCNVLGCYTTSSATTNYSLYAHTTSPTAKYLRYGNGTYNSYVALNHRYDVVITPTGSHGMMTDSEWTAKTFEAESNLLIGTTSTGATSSKLVGTLFGDIEVDGRALFIPVERIADGEIGYYDVFNDTFIVNQGNGTPTELI